MLKYNYLGNTIGLGWDAMTYVGLKMRYNDLACDVITRKGNWVVAKLLFLISVYEFPQVLVVK